MGLVEAEGLLASGCIISLIPRPGVQSSPRIRSTWLRWGCLNIWQYSFYKTVHLVMHIWRTRWRSKRICHCGKNHGNERPMCRRVHRLGGRRTDGVSPVSRPIRVRVSERPLENLRPLPLTVSLPLQYLTAVIPLYRYTAVM